MTGFWTDYNTEPKRAYRWVLYIGGIPQWICKKVTKPSYSISETPHKYINHTFWYPGKVEWNTISLTLVDPVDPDASKTIQDIVAASGYHFPKDPNDVTTISKAKAVESLGRVSIQQIGSEEGEIIEEWELTNAWIKDVKLGELSYDEDGMVEIELELRYDFAELVKSGTAVPLP